ncbi:tail fiber assembly protein [Pantoea ananatis]|uniref:tail fiber assembly protein n=1 Tax=Pantoea ananas TaxID=553 RepID=UPI001B3062D1|nr:tail fiber assembly protein [Pantoea ananatis]
MTKFITVGVNGEITGMYLDDPGGGVELSNEDWNSVGPGYTYFDGKLTPPPEPTDEEIKAQHEAEVKFFNEIEKESRLSFATKKIVVWQTKLLIGRKLTDSESLSLNNWMDYIDALHSIDADTSDKLSWPVAPD